MCTYCPDHESTQLIHVACQFCGEETRWLNTSYLYDLDKGGKIVRRHLACNTCRNILAPKE